MGKYCVTITLLLPKQFEMQSNGIPSSSWVPVSGLLVSGVMKEVRGTGEDGVWLRARDARKGFPEDMLDYRQCIALCTGRSS